MSSKYKSLRESYLSLKVNNKKGKKYMIPFGFMLGYIGQRRVQRVMTVMGGGLKKSLPECHSTQHIEETL